MHGYKWPIKCTRTRTDQQKQREQLRKLSAPALRVRAQAEFEALRKMGALGGTIVEDSAPVLGVNETVSTKWRGQSETDEVRDLVANIYRDRPYSSHWPTRKEVYADR